MPKEILPTAQIVPFVACVSSVDHKVTQDKHEPHTIGDKSNRLIKKIVVKWE